MKRVVVKPVVSKHDGRLVIENGEGKIVKQFYIDDDQEEESMSTDFTSLSVSDREDENNSSVSHQEQLTQKQQIEAVMADMRKSSITPTTFVQRKVISASAVLDAMRHSASDAIKRVSEMSQLVNNMRKENDIALLNAEISEVADKFLSSYDYSKLCADIKLPTKNLEQKKDSYNRYANELSQVTQCLDSNKTRLVAYEDIYKYGSSSVMHFGINAACLFPDSIIPQDSTVPVSNNNEFLSKPKSNGSKGSKKSGGDNISAVSKLLHPLEVYTMQKALEYLLGNNGSKSVLIDIFERDEEGSIIKKDIQSNEQKEDDEVEPIGLLKLNVHTVTLFKNKVVDKNVNEQKINIIVIDPNKSSHSSHLADLDNGLRIFGPDVTVVRGKYGADSSNIIKFSKDLNIYTGVKDKDGPNSDQYRDCSDVAVKIALALNSSDSTLDNINKMGESDVINEISNATIKKDVVETEMHGIPAQYNVVLRMKQASDPIVRKKTHFLITQIYKQIEAQKELSPEDPDEKAKTMYKKMIEALSINYAPEGYGEGITSLCQLYTENFGEIVKSLGDLKTGNENEGS